MPSREVTPRSKGLGPWAVFLEGGPQSEDCCRRLPPLSRSCRDKCYPLQSSPRPGSTSLPRLSQWAPSCLLQLARAATPQTLSLQKRKASIYGSRLPALCLKTAPLCFAPAAILTLTSVAQHILITQVPQSRWWSTTCCSPNAPKHHASGAPHSECAGLDHLPLPVLPSPVSIPAHSSRLGEPFCPPPFGLK